MLRAPGLPRWAAWWGLVAGAGEMLAQAWFRDAFSAGAGNTRAFRGGGTALASACRTVRRCTRCLSASSRIDNPSRR